MITRCASTVRPAVRGERGFTLVELMVTVAIALFLLGGLLTVVQNVRQNYLDQQALAQLQDQQRFAMTVITDVVQAAGYFPNPQANTPLTALPAAAPYAQGQAVWGSHANALAAPGDTLGVRYMTAVNDGVIVCTGVTNTAFNPTHTYTNTFNVAVVAGVSQLQCSLDGAAPVALVNGVTNMQIFYGVKRNFGLNDYNVDTYLTADQMLAADWANISSIRVQLTFVNPLNPNGNVQGQPANITFQRVVEVMARAGVHT
jgi:type IV pilus assembly protein PilW